MFPRSIREKIEQHTPKLNPSLAHGIAIEHINGTINGYTRNVEHYIDQIMKSAFDGFLPGFEYVGFRRTTPIEEYREVTKKRNSSKSTIDVARHDAYMVEYKFRYNDVPISRFIYLPFIGDAGTIYISGSRFIISPILSDRVISVGLNNAFVRLLKAKLTFNRLSHFYIANDVRENIQVAWSEIYNDKAASAIRVKRTVNASCTLAHYLFCKYGMDETFKKFANCTPVVGTALTIDEKKYPRKDWVICKSSGVKPKGFGRTFYEASEVVVAIRVEEYTPMVKNLLGGFFYCTDHFPTRIRPEYINSTRLWMILLGHLIWSGNIGEGKLYNDVADHIASLDEYIDNLLTSNLKDIGYTCPDFYTLLAIIIENFNDWLLTSDDRVNTMYNKELSVLYYVCYDITSAIFKLYFKLKAAQKKQLNEKKIVKIMTTILKPGLIFRLSKDHGEVSTTTASGDNKALKLTTILVPQSSISRNRSRKDKKAISDPTNRLHASVAEVGGYANLPKSDPTGHSRINLHMKIGPNGVTIRDPKFIKLIDDVQLGFKRS
jgi:hypothetical protein